MMQNKVAIVTGSTSGIGLGIAEHLASKKFAIVLNGFGDREKIDNEVTLLSKKYNVDVLYDSADMTHSQQIESMIQRTESRLGGVHVLVNNAGVQHVEKIENFPKEKWEQIIAINLSAAFHTIKHCMPVMKRQKFGRIVNVASAHGLIASPYKSAYVASKHGLVGLTKVVAMEGAEYNVNCNAICPGYVKTPLVENQIAATAKERGISEESVIKDVMLGEQPTKKFVTVEQIAELVAYLVSDNAYSVTGDAIPIDGGWTAH